MQELEGVKDKLRAEQSQDEKALREQQFRLAAFTAVVLRLLCDEVPKAIRLHLLRNVRCMWLIQAVELICICSQQL